MKKVKIYYLLNEEGRKKSLLQDGDGKRDQMVTAEITAEILDLIKVDCEGNAVIDLRGNQSNNNDVEIKNGNEHSWKGYWDSCPKLHYFNNNREIDNNKFSEPKTADELLIWERERVSRIAEREKELLPELERLTHLYKAYRKKVDAENAERERVLEENRLKERKARELRELEEKNLVEKQRAEKDAWIKEFGSDFLKDATSLGHNCQKCYVTERLNKELPEFSLDFHSKYEWADRSCPSPEALEKAKSVIASGLNAEIVWMTGDGITPEYYGDEFKPYEAIVVTDYLDKYTIYIPFQ